MLEQFFSKNLFWIVCLFSSALSLGCSTKSIAENQIGSTNQRQVASEVPAVIIQDPSVFTQIFAISDVHGMYQPLLTLLRAAHVIDLQNHWIAGSSALVVIGDSIDKGPQSIDVLDLWIQLRSEAEAQGGQLIHVLGNHEAEFLADPSNDQKATELLAELSSRHLPLTELTTTTAPRGLFLHTEPVAARLGKWLFIHSGYFPQLSWSDFSNQAQAVLNEHQYSSPFLLADDSVLECKDWEKNDSIRQSVLNRMDTIGLFGIMFGHQPKAFGIKARSSAQAGGRLIKIDNGMAPEAGSHSGSLLVFSDPKQLNNKTYPSIKIIFPDGSSQDLKPE